MQENVTPREAVEMLHELRFKYQTKQLELTEALKQGQPYLEIYNNHSKEVAKKYGVKPQLIKNNIIYW